MFIIDGKHFHSNDTEDHASKHILMETISYLFNAYSQKRRRLGPLAVLHPLRTAALFARNFNPLNLISVLLLPTPDLCHLPSALKNLLAKASFASETIKYSVGTKSRVSTVATISPKLMLTAMGIRNWA